MPHWVNVKEVVLEIATVRVILYVINVAPLSPYLVAKGRVKRQWATVVMFQRITFSSMDGTLTNKCRWVSAKGTATATISVILV